MTNGNSRVQVVGVLVDWLVDVRIYVDMTTLLSQKMDRNEIKRSE